MRVLLAFDKFKDALTARQACDIAARALHAKHPGWQTDLCPLTDGGEGFCETLASAVNAKMISVRVTGPRGAPVDAPFALVPGECVPDTVRRRLRMDRPGTLGLVGLAEASGLALLSPGERDPWHATTFGAGQLLRAAIDEGADRLLLGLGGSATNDLGLGALAALGLQSLKTGGTPVVIPTPVMWPEIVRLRGAVELPPLFIACDVTNPLLGPRGATATFGPQKGLISSDLPKLESRMSHLAMMLCHHFNRPDSLMDTPGAGAAGGIGFGFMAAGNAQLVPGFDLVSDWLGLPEKLAAADLVITGEGRFDATSLGGKGPGSIAAEARRLGKRVRIFAGSLGVEPDGAHHAITPPGMPLPEALRRAPDLLAAAVAREL